MSPSQMKNTSKEGACRHDMNMSASPEHYNVDKKWVWVPCAVSKYKAGFITSLQGDYYEVNCQNEIVKIKKSNIQRMNPQKFDMAEDLASLSYLNEASVLYNLKKRYASDFIYTYSGLFLLAINPYRSLGIYGKDDIRKYTLTKKEDCEPHIFAVANEAYNSMLSTRENQSILITGESGAGKTENTKRVIEFLSSVAGHKCENVKDANFYVKNDKLNDLCSSTKFKSNVHQQLIEANPILEAFGNAQTVKNDNSSRFGKFIKIKFSGGNICGAHVEKYLLEKSRIASQNSGERNYHIFYQLISGADEKLRAELCLFDSPSKYRFLQNSKLTVEGIDDVEDFCKLKRSLALLGIVDEQSCMFRMISAILLMGNIEFKEESDQAEILNLDIAEKVCYLLSISLSDFIKCLIHPVILAGNEFVTHHRSKDQVLRIIEALAKILYDKMFDWIVRLINNSLDTSQGDSFIGVLDIAGFEIFKTNSFEQLCINFTNEKLQQFFNHHMFILEQEIYRKEKIAWNFIDFGLDLQPTIDLIEKSNPIGILSYLDEECVMPKGTDKTFLEKLCKNIPRGKFEPLRFNDGFMLNHYAGVVEYNVNDWLSKNKDPHFENLTQLISTSSEATIKNLDCTEYNSAIKKGFFRTVAQKHKEQLSALMSQLSFTNPHFVRCIIPNLKKTGDFIDPGLILEQLKCNGVLEGIRISRLGFPSRMTYEDFNSRYILLLDPVQHNSRSGLEDMTRTILNSNSVKSSEYRLGLTKVFFRQGVLAELEDVRDMKIGYIAREIRNCVLRKLTVRKYTLADKRRQAIKIIQKNAKLSCDFQRWSWWRLYIKIKPLLDVGRQENEMKEKDEMIKKYLEALEEEKKRSNELDTQIKAMEANKSVLEEEIAKEKRFSLEKDELNMALRLKNEDLMEESRKLIAELKQLRKEKDNEVTNLQSEIAKEKDNNAVVSDKLVSQTALVKSLEARINELDEQIVENRKKGKVEDKLNNRVDQLTRDSQLKEKIISELNGKIREKEHEANLAIKSLQEQLDSKMRRICELEDSNAKLEEQAKNNESLLVSLKAEHDTVEKKLMYENQDLIVENEKLESETRKLGFKVQEQDNELRRVRSELDLIKMKNEKIKSSNNLFRKEVEELETKLREAKENSDLSEQKEFTSKFKALEKKIKGLTEKLSCETLLNSQLVAENEQIRQDHLKLSQSKLDDIFKRENEFSKTKKALKMEIQRLEVENQKLNLIAEQKSNSETSDESTSVIERLHNLLESEKKSRREIELQLLDKENAKLMLENELEEVQNQLTQQKKDQSLVEEKLRYHIQKNKNAKKLTFEVDNVINEVNELVTGFNDTYYNILNEQINEIHKLTNIVKEKEVEIMDQNKLLDDQIQSNKGISQALDSLTVKARELDKKYSLATTELDNVRVKNTNLGTQLEEKEAVVVKLKEIIEELQGNVDELRANYSEKLQMFVESEEARRALISRMNETQQESLMALRDQYEVCKSNIVKDFEDKINSLLVQESLNRKILEEKLNSVIDKERKKNEASKENITKLKELVSVLEAKLSKLNDEHDAVMLEVSALRSSETHAITSNNLFELELRNLQASSQVDHKIVDVPSKVVYVTNKEKLEAIDRKKLILERELRSAQSDLKLSEANNAILTDEIANLKVLVDKLRHQLFATKKELITMNISMKQINRELKDEKELVNFLKPFSLIRRSKN